MTLSTTINRNQYTVGSSSTQTVFAYAFKIQASTDILVYLGTTKQTSGYSVSGAGAASGGNVTFTSAPTSTDVSLIRSTPLSQSFDLVANDPFPAESFEDILDKSFAALQDRQEELGRALKFATTSALKDKDFPDLTGNSLKYLQVNTDADGLVFQLNPTSETIDAKGDLLGGTAADTYARLAVGTDGQHLTASSGASTGLAWATPAVTSYTNSTDNRVLTSGGGTIVNGEANLTFNGTVLTSPTANISTLQLGGVAVTATGAEINACCDGSTSATSTTLTSTDTFVCNDAGTMKQVALSDLDTFMSSNVTSVESTITANNSTDETVYPVFVDGATGVQGLESDTGLTYNPSSGVLTSTNFAGTGTFTSLDVDSLRLNNATISATTDTNIDINPPSGRQVVIDGAATFDSGVITGCSSVTSTVFVGALTGTASTATALATGRTIGCTGDVVWTSASFDGSGNVTGTATIQANSVALGTDTAGNYVGTVTAGTGLTSTGATSGEGIAHSLSVDAAQTQITSVGALAGLTTTGGSSVFNSTAGDYDFTVVTPNIAKMIFVDGGNETVSIGGTAYTSSTPLTVTGTARTGSGTREVIAIFDNTAVADAVGSGILFGGRYEASTNLTEFASIYTEKENSTSGQYGGELKLGTRPHGGGITTALTISSAQNVEFAGDLSLDNAAGPALLNEAATSSNPTCIPNRADPSTGVGWHSTSKLALIAGGTMAVALEATQITLATTAHFAGRIQMPEISVPTGAANYCFLYTYDTGGKTRLACKLGSDTEIVIATQA
ncbi:endo-N-acetylneuraminidase [uncultured Mediterranean phage uvDeep-CGR2-AD3-C191]|nr:endo-N-acetylneuraminidase [uncultured Mediterranean phage uvDeep-CGR2-AD3-C191]